MDLIPSSLTYTRKVDRSGIEGFRVQIKGIARVTVETAKTADRMKGLAFRFATVAAVSTGKEDYLHFAEISEFIAEGDATIAPYAAPNTGNFTLEVDAAIIAQTGSVLYPSNYTTGGAKTKGWVGSSQIFKYYGSVATRQTWTWQWLTSSGGNAVKDPVSGNWISGFLNSTTQYDYNLLYAPPPSFPITSSYNILSWREVLVTP
jgi:hypothetical protein